MLDTAWNNLMLGLRLGQSPRCVATTTPKPNALIRTILGRASTVVTRGTTFDNLSNLARRSGRKSSPPMRAQGSAARNSLVNFSKTSRAHCGPSPVSTLTG